MPTSHSNGTIDRPERILLAVDASWASRQALAYVRSIASPAATIRIVSVAENPRGLMPASTMTGADLEAARAELLHDATAAADEACDTLTGAGLHVECAVIDLSTQGGDVSRALAEAAADWQAELLVVGARQHHGLARWIEGTVSEPLEQASPCPLLIVPESCVQHAPTRILFAVDGSSQASAALSTGLRFAPPGAKVRAVYVVDRAVRLTDFVPIHVLEDAFREEGKLALAHAASQLARGHEHASTALIETERSNDDIAHAIMREAQHWHADLLVMGTHGRRGIARWFLGSVAGRTARITPVPLLLIRSADAA